VTRARRRSLVVLAWAVVPAACASNPTNITCNTKAQSVTYLAVGSCSGEPGGKVTISTQPGLCSLLVKGAPAVGLPTQGQFFGTAADTGFDLRKGNWYLFVGLGNSSDGSLEILCDESMQGPGEINLQCSGSICSPDDGTGGSCTTIDCVEHLFPEGP
jgi:hypothetical protein